MTNGTDVKKKLDDTIEKLCDVVQKEVDNGVRNTNMITALAVLVKARAELEEKFPASLCERTNSYNYRCEQEDSINGIHKAEHISVSNPY